MAHFEYSQLIEIVKNNNLNFSNENWNTDTINKIIPYINRYFKIKNKTINKKYSSIKLKSWFTKLICKEFYITLEDFIIAMIACGFTCKIIKYAFYFNIAEKDIKTIDKIINPEFYV